MDPANPDACFALPPRTLSFRRSTATQHHKRLLQRLFFCGCSDRSSECRLRRDVAQRMDWRRSLGRRASGTTGTAAEWPSTDACHLGHLETGCSARALDPTCDKSGAAVPPSTAGIQTRQVSHASRTSKGVLADSHSSFVGARAVRCMFLKAIARRRLARRYSCPGARGTLAELRNSSLLVDYTTIFV